MDVQLQRLRAISLVVMLPAFLLCSKLFSQDYKYEMGGMAGAASYVGDANPHRLFLRPGASGGLLFRYNANLQWAIKATLLGGTVSGETRDTRNRFPLGQHESFQRAFAEVGSQVEFNFFRYSNEYEYLGTKHYTPYLFAGAGITLSGGNNSFLGVNVPFGIGFKYKLKNRVNIGAELSMRKLFRDDFDVVDNTAGWNLDAPIGIESSLLKNKDWYSLAMIYLTWDFGNRSDPCR